MPSPATWHSDPPEMPPLGPGGWARVAGKGTALGAVVFGGLLILLLIRFVEKPVHGTHRPWTPWVTQGVCRAAFLILGITHRTHGARMSEPGAVVANHASWLDIFALNARKRVYFVSKAEVAGWPGIGWLARATGTVFIERVAQKAVAQRDVFRTRLTAGHKLLFFPEGTSSDGLRVLPFKSTLFAAFFSDELRDLMHLQPVTVVYTAPDGADPRFYGWWGDMGFGEHLLQVLGAPRHGAVDIHYHAPVKVGDFADRKTLARYAEGQVRSAFPEVAELS
ncbi:lyso-ornithine lipid O-acyltransferase [Ovoidimarina sediminis]|uniref:lysophospholipid acyltransferase family protein n=1 Tax=Ovoidimarina sediminis TaxID=3079856 RepID=UPI00290DF0DD|nr:lysophospholipid acyltransferase family protein [Rhodophyticola sp. MJ-SS7]MDU8944971.1 lysophospholipid acyltransferase family protein [Rhodophyticola sp. MJ-SS7]